MWRLSPQCHTLGRLYRFLEPELEEAYVQKSAKWRVYPAMVHFYGRFFFSVMNCCSFIGSPSLPVSFYIYASMAGLASIFILCGHFLAVFKKHPIAFHSTFCVIFLALLSCLVYFLTVSWTQDNYSIWVPANHHLLLQPPPGEGPPSVQDNAVLEYVGQFSSKTAIGNALGDLVGPWACLALSGLSWLTIPVFGVMVTVPLVTFALTPHVVFFHALGCSLMVAVFSGAFLAITLTLERARRSNYLAETLLARELCSSQMADTILNHTLKNTMADVAGNIELFVAGRCGVEVLSDCLACLQRGMKRCKDRLLYLRLAAGDYVPTRSTINLKALGEELTVGRSIVTQFVDCAVLIDYGLCSLILDNAVSNAFKHGCPVDPDVHFHIEDVTSSHIPGLSTPLQSGHRRFCLKVTNRADPDQAKITPALAQQLFRGQFQCASKPLSDHAGLPHCLLAAQQAGITLSLSQEGDRVTFTALLDAAPAYHYNPALIEVQPSSAVDFPEGLRFVIIDDSAAARRLVEFHLNTWCAPLSVVCLGEQFTDATKFLALALEGADVLIIDQHLDYPQRTVYGTDLVKELRRRGFQGLACIRSANDMAVDRAVYAAAGVQCVVGKDVPGRRMVEELRDAYLSLQTTHAQRRGSLVVDAPLPEALRPGFFPVASCSDGQLWMPASPLSASSTEPSSIQDLV